MQVRKMAGWCLILMGVARVFQMIHLQAVPGQGVDVFHVVVTSVLLTVGAAFLWLERAPWQRDSV